jgi:hypothetical protein
MVEGLHGGSVVLGREARRHGRARGPWVLVGGEESIADGEEWELGGGLSIPDAGPPISRASATKKRAQPAAFFVSDPSRIGDAGQGEEPETSLSWYSNAPKWMGAATIGRARGADEAEAEMHSPAVSGGLVTVTKDGDGRLSGARNSSPFSTRRRG